MATNVNVEKNKNENNSSILRKFTRKVRGSGVLQAVRGKRYYSRKPSGSRRKEDKLMRLERTARYQELAKLGKIGS